ncbi:MAG: hypothetical protein NVSMB9_00770 [Isosphaeraceae bacterium]
MAGMLMMCVTPHKIVWINVALFSSLSVYAYSDPPSKPPVASDPIFVVLKVDGTSLTGRIRELSSELALTLVKPDGHDEEIPLNSFVRLSRETLSASAAPEASVILFPEGDRLYRTAIGAANETTLAVQSFSLNNLTVPLESMLGLIFTFPFEPEMKERLILQVRDEPRASEMLWLTNGDKLSGGLLGLTDKIVEIQRGMEPLKLERTGLIALGFDHRVAVYPKPKMGYLEITLTDGSRLGVTNARVDQGQILAITRFGARIQIGLQEILRIHARSPSIVYLSECVCAHEDYVPYIGSPRPFRKDSTVEGHTLKIAGEEFEHGIGTQSRTLLAYRLQRGDRRFQAQVGLDDSAGSLGSVVFRVIVDGKERFLSQLMATGDPAKTIDVEIAGAKTLVLISEFGERGGVRDFADWGGARVIR